MPKPAGLGPRLVAIQNAGITKEEAGKQIAAQTAAGVPPENMVFVNPDTKVVVPANVTTAPATMPVTVQQVATAPTATPAQIAVAATPRYNFLGIDITSLVVGWNSFWKKLGFGQTYKTNEWDGLGQAYKTNEWDGTISELERK